jgi:FKBP-type peptidyl-prolyl cis-trans isomerase FkpA
MRKLLILCLVTVSLVTSSCMKNDGGCRNKTVGSEEAAITAYATANGINATRHASGLYYQVINPGSGTTPTTSSTVTVKYVGKLLDGTIFDQNSIGVALPLSNVIAGWQIGIPLIQKGGQIKLIIPSSLAYGCTGQGPIPANAILYFDVTLVDVQ